MMMNRSRDFIFRTASTKLSDVKKVQNFKVFIRGLNGSVIISKRLISKTSNVQYGLK